MTARQTTAGTASDGYRVDPPPIPRPSSSSEDPREPGRRRP
jgi:hypothetical protein